MATLYKCPRCVKSMTLDIDVPDHVEGRRVSRMVTCSCDTIVRYKSREGWGRWYQFDWSSITGAHSGPCFEQQAYYERETGSAVSV